LIIKFSMATAEELERPDKLKLPAASYRECARSWIHSCDQECVEQSAGCLRRPLRKKNAIGKRVKKGLTKKHIGW